MFEHVNMVLLKGNSWNPSVASMCLETSHLIDFLHLKNLSIKNELEIGMLHEQSTILQHHLY